MQFVLRCPPLFSAHRVCCAALVLDYNAIECPKARGKKTNELRGRRAVQAGKETENAFRKMTDRVTCQSGGLRMSRGMSRR